MSIRPRRHSSETPPQNAILNLNEPSLEFVEFVPFFPTVETPLLTHSQPSITGSVYVVAPLALR